MRYFSSEDVVFTNAMGKTVTIKNALPIPKVSEKSVSFKLSKGDSLDEIATRTSIYGDGHESDAYKIFSENVEELTFVKFDMDKLRSIRIPS